MKIGDTFRVFEFKDGKRFGIKTAIEIELEGSCSKLCVDSGYGNGWWYATNELKQVGIVRIKSLK
jgi:hypothetical protein